VGFAVWLTVAVVGSLGWSALSWSMLQRRVRRNRAGRCAHCDAPLGEERTRIRGLLLCADCARRARRVVAVASRALGGIVVGGSILMAWAVYRVWDANRRGAWLMLGLWALYATVLVSLAMLSARDAREAGRRIQRMERAPRAADTPGPPAA
jgi:hypothetical protein